MTSIMAQEVTQIVVAFPPGVHSSPTRIIAPPQAIPILCQMEYTSIHLFRSPTYSFLVSAISDQGPRPDFNNCPGGDLN